MDQDPPDLQVGLNQERGRASKKTERKKEMEVRRLEIEI
jgi:hypothetical protein